MNQSGQTELQRIRLQSDHAELALRLSQEAGWNQTQADWRLMIEAGDAVGVWSSDQQLIASALTLPFGGPFAWISMVLVTADYRHRGIATQLLRDCLEHASQIGNCIPGCHEVLRRQGLLAGTWCLDPGEILSPGQAQEIERVHDAYPHLHDDPFVSRHLDRWLT